MPGNEVGDRIHNFFGQENLSQGQQHPEIVNGTWEGLDNNQWIGSQRQISTPFVSSLKNHSVQQSAEFERVNVGQSSGMQPGVNFSRSILRPELARSQSQNQQPTLNGYMHGNQVFQTRQNQANHLGMELESNRCDLASRGFSILDAQMGSGPEHQKKNLVRTDFNESPVNFDFLGCQQQLSGQHPGVFQSIPRQRSGNNDMQILQQQAMFRQMQEIQRQQQLQKQQMEQQEGRQLNSVYQASSFAKQASGSLPSALLNGIPIHDASNYPWQPELMTANANWPQRGIFPAVQGSSSGLMFSPEQDQTSQTTGMIPQQVDQSLYGVPISGARIAANQYSPIQTEKSTLQHISGSSNSFPGNHHNGFPDQAIMQNSTFVSRQGYQGKNMIGTPDSQGLNSGFQQLDLRQSNDPGQDFNGRQDLVGPSETSQDKTVMQVSSSENVATLDPTEEKILYGSDDNLWEAFGRGVNAGSGSYNMLEGANTFGAFPSVQSGSWSALMQSAVAETSSADMGLQEEWSGLAYRSSEPPSRNQLAPSIVDSGKQQPCWSDNRLQTGTLPNVSSYNLSEGNNAGANYNNMAGVKQSGTSVSHEQIEMPHASQRFARPSLEERTKWLDHKPPEMPVSEGSHNDEKVLHSSDAEPNAKSMSGAVLQNQGNETSLQASQATEHKSPMFEALGYGAVMWKTSSVSNSLVEVEHAISTTRSPLVNGEDSNLKNVGVLPDSSNVRSNQESIQQLSNGNSIDICKHVNSSVNPKGQEFFGKFKSHMDKSHQMFESPGNSSLGSGNGTAESHDYPYSKETKHNRSHNVPHHTSPSGGRENTRLDANDLPGGKHLPTSHISRKPSGVRKFQYHPMGDLDVDVEHSYGMRHVTYSQSMPTQVSQGLKGYNYGGVGQSNSPAQMSRNSMEIEKGQFPGFQGETKKPDEVALRNRLSGSMACTSTSFDLPVHGDATSKTLPSSQNMLELLHKVDQSRERGDAVQFSSSDCNQSLEMHKANDSAGSVPQNQSSASQGFGLQLAPPSQPFPVRDQAFSSQGVSQTTNSPSQETSQGESRNNVSGTARHSSKSPQGNFSTGFPPGFSHSRSHLQNQQMYDMGGQATNSQPVNVYFDRFVSQSKQTNESLERAKSGQSSLASVPDPCRSTSQNSVASSSELPQLKINNQNTAKDSSQQFPILESVPANQGPTASGMSQEKATGQMSPAFWTGVSTQVSSNMFTSNLQSNNDSQILSRPQKLGHSAHITETAPSESGIGFGNSHGYIAKDLPAKGDQSRQVTSDNDPAKKTMSISRERESVVNCVAGTDSNSTQREIEAFGRSLRPNNILHQNYSQMHQFQGIKNVEVDPANRSLKRFKGPDVVGDDHQVGLHGVYGDTVRDPTTNQTSVCTGDSRMLNFSAKSTNGQETNISAQDMHGISRDDSQNFAGDSAAYARTNHSQISPQMAPSWFDQYGTLKNGQISPVHDVSKHAALKTMEAPFTAGRPSNSLYAEGPVEQGSAIATDDSQHGLLQRGSSSLMASENLSSSRLMYQDAATVSLAVLGTKKRKTATSELVPWHKQVAHGCQMLNISGAELDWSRAANRLTENVEDEAEMLEDALPVFRSKRRLILTTQLMQLLFRPPLASIFSADARSYYESIVHFLARSTLGDASSTFSCSGNHNSMPSSSGSIVPEKTSERIRDQYFSKVVEDLISRARKVENDILRLDKRASVMDLRVECQELERYSIINHFAKFHSRENPSPSDAYRKSSLQRYVTAIPMPKNLPDRVQCFSL